MQSQGTLHVEKFGQKGPPLVLMHGWGHSIENLRGLAEVLAWRFTVYAIDLPGFGQSSVPPDDWGTSEYARCVHEYVEREIAEQVVLVGHSFGGRVSIQFAAQFPEKVASVVLLNSSGLPPVRTFPKQLRFLVLRYAAKALKLIDSVCSTQFFADYFAPKFGSADYKKAGSLRTVFVRTVNEDLSAEARAMRVPTLLLWGERDTETPIALGQRLKNLIPNAKMVVLEGHGHEPFRDVGAHLCAFHVFAFHEEGVA